MKLLTKITKPILLHWSQDLFLTIPRIVCGTCWLLILEPYVEYPADANLGLFEVAFGFQ
jgi:putative oxidoreductase